MIFPGKNATPVAIVTGAARGLGMSIAQRLANDGASVVIADVREPDPGVSTDLVPRATFVYCDVSASKDVDHLIDTVIGRFGRLDIMVANAGIGGGTPVVEMTDDVFRKILSVNLEGTFYCCRAAARAMIPAGGGVIITVGSIFGRDTPARSAAYGASKAGVMALTGALARELGPHGIRVNCVSPGTWRQRCTGQRSGIAPTGRTFPSKRWSSRSETTSPWDAMGRGEMLPPSSASLSLLRLRISPARLSMWTEVFNRARR